MPFQNPRHGSKWLCKKCKTWCQAEAPRCAWCGAAKPKVQPKPQAPKKEDDTKKEG